MGKRNIIELEGRATSTDPLTELLRTSARQLVHQAVLVRYENRRLVAASGN